MTVPPSPNPLLPEQSAARGLVDAPSLLAFRTPLQEHPQSADSKAAAVLATLGILFAVVGRFSPALAAGLDGSRWMWLQVVPLAGFVLASLGAVIQAFRTISPRFPKAPPSLAFFGDIAALTREEYVGRVEAVTEEEALVQITSFNHTLSRIIIEKFRQMRRCLRLFQWAFVCWLLTLLVLAVREML